MRIKQFLIAVGVGMMLASCSSDEMQTEKAGGIPINFTANIQNLIPSVGTRVADETPGMITTSFPDGATIKVGIATYSGGQLDADSYLTNSSGSWTYTSESVKQYLAFGATSKRIAAFYPAPNSDIWRSFYNMNNFTISSDQSTIDNYRSSDLLGAVVAVTQANAESVELNFKHLGAKVIVNVKNGSSNVDGYTITMKNVNRSVPMSASDNTISIPSNGQKDKGSVTFGVSSSTGQAAIIIPQTISSGTPLFEVTKEGVTYTFTTTEDITLQSGYSYTFNLKFEDTEIGFGNVSISDWGPDPDKPTIDGTLTEQTT